MRDERVCLSCFHRTKILKLGICGENLEDGSNDWMDNSAFNTLYTWEIYLRRPLSNSRVATEGERREEKGREEERWETDSTMRKGWQLREHEKGMMLQWSIFLIWAIFEKYVVLINLLFEMFLSTASFFLQYLLPVMSKLHLLFSSLLSPSVATLLLDSGVLNFSRIQGIECRFIHPIIAPIF